MFIVAWLHNVMHLIPRPLLSASYLSSRHLAFKVGYCSEQNQCLISLYVLITTEIRM